MTERFPADIQALLAQAEEIEIVTSEHDQGPRHVTIIWPVVDDQGHVLVRSVRGTRGRWFREAVANPSVAILVDGREIPATALVATDEERVAAASRGYRSKYPPGPSVDAMLRDRVLGTTLELVPR
ncbi:MAG: DUF2255 family protein [Chloroflexi bacterium]|nr:MAG: DUF2255 family protein [Chloroflexota bacterium]